MTTVTADSMNRIVKLALDSGEAEDLEEAKNIFTRYRLQIHVGKGWADTLAGEAAFLTALNTANRAFLGGVWVSGDVSPLLRVPLFSGKTMIEAINELGGKYISEPRLDIPTIVIGRWDQHEAPIFCIRVCYNGWQAGCVPVWANDPFSMQLDNPLAGVAAAALSINEAFLHVRGELLSAGDREVGMSLWRPDVIDNWSHPQYCGPELEYLPASLWLIGLGHLGQAYAWMIGMLPYPAAQRPYLVLQDIDTVAESNLSTCLFVSSAHIGQRKTRLVAARLESIGIKTDIIERRFTDTQRTLAGEPSTALFGVDNIAARRAIESAGFGLVVEAGLGSGHRDFRNIRSHVFPGPLPSTEVWSAADAVSPAVTLSPTYERMATVE